MNSRRWMAAALAVAMLALAGTGLAHPLLRAEADVETPFGRAHAEAVVPAPLPHDHDRDDSTAPPSPPRNQTFSIAVDPRSQDAAPGETVRFAVIVKTVEERTVDLALEWGARGYDVRLEPRQLHVEAGGAANATLTVRVPAEGWVDSARFLLNATAQEVPESHYAMAEVRTEGATVPPPPEEPRFTMGVRPLEQWAGPNETVVYAVILHADAPLRVHLHALASEERFDARVVPGVVDLRPNETTRVNLTVHTPDGDWNNATIRVNATAEGTGQHEQAWVRVLREEVTTQPPPNDESSNTTAPDENTTLTPSRSEPASASSGEPGLRAGAHRTTTAAVSDDGPRARTSTSVSVTLGRTA